MRRDLSTEGYGIYFMLLELLREQPNFKYPVQDIDLLEKDFGTSIAKIEAVINQYDLFTLHEDQFFSLKLIHYLGPYLERTERARNAANIRWDKTKKLALTTENDANAYTNALPEDMPKTDEHMQGKERKGEEGKKSKESKVKQSISPEHEQEISSYTENVELLEAIRNYINMRYDTTGFTINDWVSIRLKLNIATNEDDIKIEMLKTATFHKWKSVFPIKEKK